MCCPLVLGLPHAHLHMHTGGAVRLTSEVMVMRSRCVCQGQVLVYNGPQMARQGAFVRVAVAWDEAPLTQGRGGLIPFDVQWCGQRITSSARLFITKV